MSQLLKVKQFYFPTSQAAWEGVNEMFINCDEKIFGVNNGSAISSGIAFAYNIVININKAWLEPSFDFGKMFGYRMQKWTLLVNNYVNLNKLDLMRSQVRASDSKRTRDYNYSFIFDNTHTNGKGCLIACAFCRRMDLDIPIIIANLRSSEITKRLAFDLLLLQRIGEYVYGENTTFMIQLNCNKMYCNEETSIMYHNWKPLKKVTKEFHNHSPAAEKWHHSIQKCYKKFMTCDPKEIKYKVFLRTLRQLRPELFPGAYKPLIAKDLLLQYDTIEYPENCISYSDRIKYRRKIQKQQKNENLH